MARNNFNKETVRTLAARAGHTCSNSKCNNPTSMAEVVDDKAIYIGVAAHIRAASPGGPRYDPKQTPAQRSSIENGIHLCQSCSKLIDVNNGIGHPPELLLEWKKQREAMTRSSLNGLIPLRVSINEINGFSVLTPERQYRTIPTLRTHREFEVHVNNPCPLTLENINIRFEFMRVIVECFAPEHPRSTNFYAGPIQDDRMVTNTNMPAQIVGSKHAGYTYQVELSKMIPGAKVKSRLLVSAIPEDAPRFRIGSGDNFMEMGGMMVGPGSPTFDENYFHRANLLVGYHATLRGETATRQYAAQVLLNKLPEDCIDMQEIPAGQELAIRHDFGVR